MINACGNRVIVRIPNCSEHKTPGGIVVPSNQQDDVVAVGEVMSVGPGRVDTETIPCAASDFAYFKRSPHETLIDKDQTYQYLVLEFGQILAVKADD